MGSPRPSSFLHCAWTVFTFFCELVATFKNQETAYKISRYLVFLLRARMSHHID